MIKNLKKKILKYFYNPYYHLKYYLDNKLYVLHIEFTSFCNFNCKFCSYKREEDGYMDFDLFKRIIENVPNSIKKINLWQAGETTLHPKFIEFMNFLAIVKKKRKKFPKVHMYTNGYVFTKKKIDAVLKNKALDIITFSIDGGRKDEYNKIRKYGWDKVLDNLEYLLKNKKKDLEVGIKSIIIHNKELDKRFEDLIRKCDVFKSIKPHNWTGSKIYNLEYKPKKGLCPFILNSLVILWNGDVVPCCADLDGNVFLGNLKSNSLVEIFNGKERSRMLKLMKKGKRRLINVCKNCGAPYFQ